MLPRVTTVVLLVCVAVACAGRRAAPAGESIIVYAVNDNFYDARIHAVYDGGQRRSLGTIPGNGGQSRTVLAWEPRALLFEILFITEGSTYISDRVDVAAGDSIEIRVPSNIRGSGFFRRISGKN